MLVLQDLLVLSLCMKGIHNYGSRYCFLCMVLLVLQFPLASGFADTIVCSLTYIYIMLEWFCSCMRMFHDHVMYQTYIYL